MRVIYVIVNVIEAMLFLKRKKKQVKLIYLMQPSIGLSGKESARNAGDTEDGGSIPGLGRSLGRGNDNPLQYSCLGNPMDRGAPVGYSPWDVKDFNMTEVM